MCLALAKGVVNVVFGRPFLLRTVPRYSSDSLLSTTCTGVLSVKVTTPAGGPLTTKSLVLALYSEPYHMVLLLFAGSGAAL